MVSVLLCFLFLVGLACALGDEPAAKAAPTRNAAEEAICRPFLTSPKTSPLIRHTPRDFRKDEDGEFSCELVLQDVNLPVQIRVTIHEGLSLLMKRHVALGKARHKTAVRHLRILAQAIPTKFSFSFDAGVWSLMRPINQPDEAVKHFHNCVHGRAAADKTITPAHITAARWNYARVLAYLGRLDEAAEEYGVLLGQCLVPNKFGPEFARRELAASLEDFLRN